MMKKKFLWMLKRLAKQKKDENDAIRKANKFTGSGKNKRPGILGKIK
jgi:hypothetical protein